MGFGYAGKIAKLGFGVSAAVLQLDDAFFHTGDGELRARNFNRQFLISGDAVADRLQNLSAAGLLGAQEIERMADFRKFEICGSGADRDVVPDAIELEPSILGAILGGV